METEDINELLTWITLLRMRGTEIPRNIDLIFGKLAKEFIK